MSDYVSRGGLKVERQLFELISGRALPQSGVREADFWTGLETLVREMAPRNRQLLARRDELQAHIDAWHVERRGKPFDAAAYRSFLAEIGYLVPEPAPFSVSPKGVDPEIATIAGPQLVVPVSNARYALNAANARWGSLYDALYGTDVISDEGGAAAGTAYNPVRGDHVIAYAAAFLDAAVPLQSGSHGDVTAYRRDGELSGRHLVAIAVRG